MKYLLKYALVSVCTILAVATAEAASLSKEGKREDIRQATVETLKRLYATEPGAIGVVERSAGYAVFRNKSLKIMVAGGGKGKGMVVENTTGEETFMNMVEIQAGLGFGIKKFRVVFVFDDITVMNQFIESGWEFGGQATAAAKTEGTDGSSYAGALSVSPGMWIYQLTDAGLALEFTSKGTKFYKDKKLN